ncbi:hypothetical protein GJ744_011808 [Endocarpon pusillum]|uniref:Uncharacterized protein n=1 Tax=Endocarpon pusillum TaxID=364733 RepID=A0A8H7AEI5_9EURO|nr:hypothetical protein GJ744_011808 [Endocarpon pusillum]
MAPIRRYLRISKTSVLECRIFLENPADGPRWLLSSEDPALPRVIEAIRPLVLPKLREETERAKAKGKKKNRIKDVVTKDEFEVSVFLTQLGTRHSFLTKSKTFNKSRITGHATKLTGSDTQPVVIREESDDDNTPLPMDRTQQEEDALGADDKKKLGLKTTYEGFSIWGWVLCLLVARKGGPSKRRTENVAGQVLMEEWISLTQEQHEDDG